MRACLLTKYGGVGLLLFLLTSVSRGAEPRPDEHVNEAIRITTEAAKRYAFELAGHSAAQLKFHPVSILRWSNPVAGEVYGNVYLWTDDEERPQVIGSIFQWFSPMTHGSHEFQSLSLAPVKGQRDGSTVWVSNQAGIEWKPAPDHPAVGNSQPVRLRQARAIARQFQVLKTDREMVTRNLRLLAQPIYHYGSEGAAVRDGYLFVFVQGTDPEVFLLLEPKRVGQSWEWRFALARMNSVQFVAKFQNQEVWRTEIWPWSKVKNGRETYTSFGPFER
jgi:hypothetical protein